MRIIPRDRIDVAGYQALLEQYRCTEAAMQPWLLDAASPGWGMLCDDHGQYLMPLPVRRKFFIPYLTMPCVGQRLQLLTPDGGGVAAILPFLRRRYPRASICLATDWRGAGASVRYTYQLCLSASYAQLFQAMTKGHRRNIAAGQGMNEVVRCSEGADRLGAMKLAMLSQRGLRIGRFDRTGYMNLVREAVERRGAPFYLALRGGELVAAALFIRVGNRYITESAAEPMGRQSMAGYALIDRFIRDHAQTDALLDFAGSSIPSIASFNAGFGALRSEYLRVQWRWV